MDGFYHTNIIYFSVILFDNLFSFKSWNDKSSASAEPLFNKANGDSLVVDETNKTITVITGNIFKDDSLKIKDVYTRFDKDYYLMPVTPGSEYKLTMNMELTDTDENDGYSPKGSYYLFGLKNDKSHSDEKYIIFEQKSETKKIYQ